MIKIHSCVSERQEGIFVGFGIAGSLCIYEIVDVGLDGRMLVVVLLWYLNRIITSHLLYRFDIPLIYVVDIYLYIKYSASPLL